MTEECNIQVGNDSNSLLSEQHMNWNDSSFDKGYQTTVSSSTLRLLPLGRPEEWSYRELHRNVFTSMHQARQYYYEGQTKLAIDAYKNTLDYCIELKRRNKNSGEHRNELNQQLSVMKHECRQQLDRLVNGSEDKKSSSSIITASNDHFNDYELYKTLNDKESFTDNGQTETPHPLVLRRLIRMLMYKTSCNNNAHPINDLSEEQTIHESFAVNLYTNVHDVAKDRKKDNEQSNRPSISITNFTIGPQKIPSPTIRQCAVCMVEQPVDQFGKRYSNQCQHMERIVCNTCVYKNTKAVLENTPSTEIRCPEPDCQAIFSYYKVRRLLLKNNNRTLFDIYDQKLTNQHLEQMSEFVWCPYPECGSGQLNQIAASNRQPIICIKCQGLICTFHRTKWHTNMTCEEYDRANATAVDNRTKQWLKKYSKLCPQCKSPIEKNGGCDHMLCTKCKYDFCWECLADYELIANQGLRHHQPTCRHYPQPNTRLRTVTTRRNACILS